MCKNLLLLTCSVLLVLQCESARILGMFPAPIISHQKVFRVLAKELASRGHQVTVIAGLPNKNKDNYREIDVSTTAIGTRNELFKENMKSGDDMYDQFVSTIHITFKLVDAVLKSEEVENLIKDPNENFDLILVEDCMKPALILSHIFKAPVILISSFGGSFASFEIMGGATHPILYPLATRKKYLDLDPLEKIYEIYIHFILSKKFNDLEERQNIIFRNRYGPDTPDLKKLYSNVQMLFLNVHSIWDSNRPVPSNVIYLGGLHKILKKELPKDLEDTLNSSTRGAIYLSFGSVVDPNIFSEAVIQIFINVFSRLPYDVYWKCNSTRMSGLPKNIKVYDWFPQSDLLRHKNIKLFITQGGLQSTDEAIAAEVPLIGIPIYWDQFFNVDKYVELKIGERLDIESLTEEILENTINKVINNKTYRDNIKKLHLHMTDSPLSSLDQAVFWIEYVLRHGAEHLRSPSMNMSWFEYYEFDIVFIITMVLVILLYLVFRFVKYLKRIIRKIKRD